MSNRKKDSKNKGEIMNNLAARAGNDIKEMGAILATFPEPSRWTQAQRDQAVQFAALLDTAQKMIAAANLAGIDYQGEKQAFLENAGKTASRHTHTAYDYALDRLDAWAAKQKIDVLELTPLQADNFIYSLKGERSNSSVRLDVAACSSFFTWLERRHAGIKNPFRGTKARPAKKTVKEIAIPPSPEAEEEVEGIISQLPAGLAAAVSVMAYRGLRIGILPTLSISGDSFTGESKGQKVKGKLPAQALEAIKKAKLPLRSPFAGEDRISGTLDKKIDALEKRLVRAVAKLYKDGKIKAVKNPHYFRHFYAVTEYRKGKDLHRVSKLLGHGSIQVTEAYLRGLGEVE
jgi:site-specific recombinase XerD